MCKGHERCSCGGPYPDDEDQYAVGITFYKGHEVKEVGWGKEEKLREIALSLAAKLKWEEEDINWPAVIYEALDKARKL